VYNHYILSVEPTLHASHLITVTQGEGKQGKGGGERERFFNVILVQEKVQAVTFQHLNTLKGLRTAHNKLLLKPF
jgi:hypothetical protein